MNDSSIIGDVAQPELARLSLVAEPSPDPAGGAFANRPPETAKNLTKERPRRYSVDPLSFVGCHVDAFTFVCPDGPSGTLATTFSGAPVEPGNSQQGFSRTESRACWGGEVWHRWDPYQASKLYGRDYHAWEIAGDHARGLAEFCRRFDDGYPTRVDVAFDFHVLDDSVTAPQLLDLLRPRIEGRTVGCTGDEPHLTQYIGSRAAMLRIRIYRKDLQQRFGPPTMRVELIMRQDRARAWWKYYRQDPEDGYRKASAWIEGVCGLRLIEHDGQVPVSEPPAQGSAATTLRQLMLQYGAIISDADRSGVDVVDMAHHAAQRRSRVSQWRGSRFRQEVESVGPDAITDHVLEGLDH